MLLVSKHGLPIVLAYVDAGAGMMMLQLLGGAALGVWFYFRRSVTRLAARFVSRRQPAPVENEIAQAATTSADAHRA